MIYVTSFSEWVRTTRRAKDLTLEEVSGRADVSQPVWSKWESGKAAPRRETVVKIADALQEPLDSALLLAGYTPSAPGGVSDLAQQIEPFLLRLRPDRRAAAERLLIDMARNLPELMAV